jgi:hypothetical protein
MELILHHYDFSHYAEKARLALGYKGLAWRCVTIPPVAPKPDQTPLTGGYIPDLHWVTRLNSFARRARAGAAGGQ